MCVCVCVCARATVNVYGRSSMSASDLSAAACIVNTVAGGAAVGSGSRMTDREKENGCGL